MRGSLDFPKGQLDAMQLDTFLYPSPGDARGLDFDRSKIEGRATAEPSS
jgi:hypothetical protein